MMTRVGWSITHQEFTITDYYYFSILQREAEKHNIIIEEVDRWEKLKDYEEQIAPTSGGYFCLAGTCVFWDNYSITLYNNLEFSLNLLKHQTPLQPQAGKQVVFGI
jgi:hypothetical protein